MTLSQFKTNSFNLLILTNAYETFVFQDGSVPGEKVAAEG